MVGRFSEFREGRRPSELREREQTETRESMNVDEYVRQVLDELQDEEVLIRFVEELFKDFDERAQWAAERLREASWEVRKEHALEYFRQEIERLRAADDADWEDRVSNAEERLRASTEESRQESQDAQLEVDERIHSEEVSESDAPETVDFIDDVRLGEMLDEIDEHARRRDGEDAEQTSGIVAEILGEDRAQEVRGLEEISDARLRDAFSEVESGELDRERLSDGLQKLADDCLESGEAIYCDIRRGLDLTEEGLRSFEEAFRETLEALDSSGKVRFGMVEERLYVWKPDLDPNRLENAYGDLYYYFRDKDAFESYIANVGESLGLETEGKNEVVRQLRELASQVMSEPAEEGCINPRLKRIRGDHVHLMNDLSGKRLSDMQDDISKLTGWNGQGGIEKPHFPQGEQLEVSVARIAATVFSDGTIEPNGVIKYGESELTRIKRVTENLRSFGDINPSSRYIEGQNHYITHFPFVIGKLLMHRGIPCGDRTTQNPRLIPSVREGTNEVKRAYIEDFTPQDACIGQRTAIWRRVNALNAGEKSRKYGLEAKVGAEEIELIKDHGRKGTGKAMSWSLSWGKLGELVKHPNDMTARTAETLQGAVGNNPNKLIHDEVTIVRDMGIDLEVKPSDVRYYPGSGRVTAVWQARTTGVKEAIKFGIVTCPNDVKNRQKVERMIAEHPGETREAMTYLSSMGIEFERWWDE